jgi:hypothetical protein
MLFTPYSNRLFGYGMFVGIFVLVVCAWTYNTIAHRIRLRAFASQNNLDYYATMNDDNRPGIIFGQGHDQSFVDVLIAHGRQFAEIGNYSYKTGAEKYETTHTFGYMRIKLPRRLPNMVLDSTKNNFLGKISNLPSGFRSDQRLSLEGDFDKYFTLYAPAEYKTDALYVFTPDVMQAMINAAHNYDCEVIDDDLYLYSSKINVTDQKQLEELIRIAETISPEIAAQTNYYADTRVPDRSLNVVATPGKRLQTRWSFFAIISIILILLYNAPYIFYLLSSLLGLFAEK